MTSMSSTVAAAPDAADGVLVGPRAWWALAPLLVGTFTGTLNNNIVNVPMKDILRDLHVPLSQGALVVIAFNLTFAVLMPLTGWLGDRLGRRRMFCAAVVTLGAGAVGAAMAPNLGILVGFRVVQGAATAAILPTVMALIAQLFPSAGRGRALGIWAAVNGLGQAVGPPVGGVLAEWAGWRTVFWPVVPLVAVALVGTLRLVPHRPGEHIPLDARGAAALTLGAALVISAATAVPTLGASSPVVVGLAVAGAASLAAFLRGIRRRPAPFIPPQLLREPSYLRSSLAVFAQMFCLGTTLLALPLYLTRAAGRSTLDAGLLVFALPAAMTLLAPAAGLVTERLGPRVAIRAGLTVLAAGEAALGVELVARVGNGLELTLALLLAGAGVAFVQTPAATGATRSPAGRYGSGLGLFNLVRFAGSALGAAWVAIVLTGGGSYAVLFGVCVTMAGLGLAGTFAGPTPGLEPKVMAAPPLG